jgi:hypothetical protein
VAVLEWILTSDEIQVKWGTRMSKRIRSSSINAGEGFAKIVNMSQAEGAPATSTDVKGTDLEAVSYLHRGYKFRFFLPQQGKHGQTAAMSAI